MRAFLYAQMAEYKRQVLTEEELLSTKPYKCIKKFNTEDDMNTYISNKGYKHGQYKCGLRLMSGSQGYASVFYYNKPEVEKYMEEKNGSISGFKGAVYTDWLYLDFDPKVYGHKHFMETITPLLDWLHNKKIVNYIFFSGNAGLHIYIPKAYVKYPESVEDQAHILCKAFYKKLLKVFPDLQSIGDDGVYSISTVFRMPFTINQKSGKLKTLMYWDSSNKKLDRMKNDTDKFSSIMKDMICPNHSNIKPLLEIKKEDVRVKVPTNISFNIKGKAGKAPKGERPCMYNLLNKDLQEGEGRHMYANIIMSWLKHTKRYPNKIIWKFLEGWNDNLTYPMPTKELENIFKYIETVNYKPCNQDCMQEFCSKDNTCLDYKMKSSNIRPESMLDVLNKAVERHYDDSPVLNTNTVFPGLDLQVKPSEGHITEIVCGSKVGKTTIATHLAVLLRVPTIIFSYEMSKFQLLTKMAKILGLDWLNPLDQEEVLEKTKHIFIVDAGRVPVQDWKFYKEIYEREYGVSIAIMIADYLTIIPVRDPNNPARQVTDKIQRISIMSEILPDLVKELGIWLILPCQPTQSVEGHGRVILLEDSAYGGKKSNLIKDTY